MADKLSLTRRSEPHDLTERIERHAYATELQDELRDGLDWRRMLRALRRYGWLVLPFALAGGGVAYITTRGIARDYRATTTIWIASKADEDRAAGDLGPIRQSGLLDANGWVDLLRSPTVLDPVVGDLRLYVSVAAPRDSAAIRSFAVAERFRPGNYTLESDSARGWLLLAENGDIVDRGAFGDSAGLALGMRWVPERTAFAFGKPVKFTLTTFRQAAEDLAGGLEVQADDRSPFLRVELRGRDPVRAAAALNAVAERYVAVAADLQARRLAELTRILGEQRTSVRGELDRAEGALSSYRVRVAGLPNDLGEDRALPGGVAQGSMTDIATELDRVRHDRDAVREWLAMPPDSRSVNGPLLLGDGRETKELQAALDEWIEKRSGLRALQYRYTDAHEFVRRAQDSLTILRDSTIPGLARRLVADLGTKERDLVARVDTLTRTLRGVPVRVQQARSLERRALIASELYTNLEAKFQEAQLAEASNVPDVRVFSEAAVPQRPLSDLTIRLVLFGVAVGVAIALALAIFLDRIDPRVRYPAEISRNMGLTILAAVPHLRARRGDSAISPADADQVTEALRGLRMALSHTGAADGPQVLAISSPGPGDGKSFLTANLGLSFAQAGYRTLVIDGDVRRGVLHRGFKLQRRPGLIDYLRGDEGLRQIVQETAFPGLSFIGCGTRLRNAPELLGKPAATALFAELKAEFDVILCDTPPLIAGIDPLVLATITGRLMLVLRTGVSLRSIAEAKLEVLDRLPVEVVGAVLNDVPPGDLYRPYTYHLRGYEVSDEPEVAGAVSVV